MMRFWTFLISLFFLPLTLFGQECPDLLNPVQGATNVTVTTSISWEEVLGVTGYIISIGTTSGGGEIVNEQAVGSDITFAPPLGLPESTQIFVTITLFFFDQPDIVCSSLAFFTEDVSTIPECTQLDSPENGDINVNVATSLNWNYAPRAIGYRITVGTSSGAGDIESNLDVGNTLTYSPAANLPNNVLIYVGVTPYNENGSAINCLEESFTTASLGDPPGCTQLITPINGAVNVELSPLLEWKAVPDAIGYKMYVGRSPFVNDILDGSVITNTSTFVLNFEPNNTYFIRIVPFNDAGEAQGCEQESFSTILGCGPFIDAETGELVTLNPEINFPDEVGICENELPFLVETEDIADGFRWYRVMDDGMEELISEENFVEISETGLYRYEAYIILAQGEGTIECPSTKEFTVLASSLASIDSLSINEENDLFSVIIVVSGTGDYEYSLGSLEGPYTDINTFSGLAVGSYTVYVRDKKGCGIVERMFNLALPPPGFPAYFSPNGDGFNDYWQYVPPAIDPLPLRAIQIFDRYGKLLYRLNPNSQGWDGRYNGANMPSEGYWYKAFTNDDRVFRGYFSIAR